MAIVDHGDGVARSADVNRPCAVAGDGVGAGFGQGRIEELPVLIKIIDGDGEIASSIGSENESFGKWIGGARLVDHCSSLRDYVLALEACPAEAPAQGSDSTAPAGAASSGKEHACDCSESDEHTSGTRQREKGTHF